MELHYVGISAAFDPYAQARPVGRCAECGAALYDGDRVYYGRGTDHVLGCGQSVSYTHLDVYKRQVLSSLCHRVGAARFFMEKIGSFNRDVYKRQVHRKHWNYQRKNSACARLYGAQWPCGFGNRSSPWQQLQQFVQ